MITTRKRAQTRKKSAKAVAISVCAMNNRIGVLMSGGVDSSMSALLLKEQGYDVIGVTAKMTGTEKDSAKNDSELIKKAESAAKILGIKHYWLDLSDEFQKEVIEYFVNSYKNGQTPNPCIVCNKKIKWGKLFDYAMNELGADYFATGHYARVLKDGKKGGKFLLYPAKDQNKDQLYYLFELNQEQLSKTIFPLADYEKEDIKQLALKHGITSNSYKESQDICFIEKPETTKKYLAKRLKSQKGSFMMAGKKLGEHNGYHEFTVGQRKGIGIAYSEPLYVVGINPEENIVELGTKEDLNANEVLVSGLNIHDTSFRGKFEANVKIRYNMNAQKAVVEIFEFEDTPASAKIFFKDGISSVSKGQAAVIYDLCDGHLIAGGWI